VDRKSGQQTQHEYTRNLFPLSAHNYYPFIRVIRWS
jgi:hypothetical protein